MTRLRPVLMTALAMIIGMLPMALGLGEGGEQNAPLGRAVIGGLRWRPSPRSFLCRWSIRPCARGRAAQHSIRELSVMTATTEVPATPHSPRSAPAIPASATAPAASPPPAHADETLPRDLRQPHTLVVIAVGIVFLALLGGLFVLGYLPHMKAQREAQEQADLASHDTSLVAVSHPRVPWAKR